ncbi:hypothetical protein [uncultured Bacteroides sp.]|uniref:hypothetical protein n=1 Tax=uncultured Bacteroides sp. TaxID=162156 RepID=UPI0026061FCA|nr:hypothetical protein [uncultured Bacteroides sp.]
MCNIDKPNTLFLLGGYDLEMCTIKDILEQKACNYADKHLKWNNASLSNYKNEIKIFQKCNPNGIIYGIELKNDLLLSNEKYIEIDHHNDKSNNPSALEQIMTLLDVQTTRYYSLVSANDKSYIPGMKKIGATESEIKIIRQSDRKAQGITDEDEILAEKAINDNQRKTNGTIIIKAYNNKFSPICDRLYPYDSLLIYTKNEWMYYGYKSKHIKEYYNEEYQKGKLFFGGGDNGYIGCIKNIYEEQEINQFINTIEYGII